MKIIVVNYEIAKEQKKTYLVVDTFEDAERLFLKHNELQSIKSMEL